MSEGTVKKSIGNYDLDKKLGEGNFAQVRLGTHSLTGEKVCVCTRFLPVLTVLG